MRSEEEQPDFEAPPKRAQLPGRKVIRMCIGSLKHHFVSSLLQLCTIAATAFFLTFVFGEMITMRTSQGLATAAVNAQGKMAQLVWILVIALLVCAISNVTSMLLSVSKRFREIGTMKCLGAFDESILVLFLVEAFILGGAGALSGAVLGALFSLLLAVAAHGAAIASTAFVGQLAGAVVLTTLTVGLLSFAGAAYPAWQASKMLPIEAMRRT